MYTLEEFPPRREPRRSEPENQGPERPARTLKLSWIPFAAVLAIGLSAAGASAFWWVERRMAGMEAELARARTELETANNSLRLLWTTTTRLDEAQAQRQDFLQDSIGTVQAFFDSEVNKLWQGAYLEHRRRLDGNAARIDAHDRSIGVILDESSQTNSRIDVLFRENESQYADLRDIGTRIEALRETLVTVTGQLGQIESSLAATRVARGQLDRRIGGLEVWMDGFTSAGLDGSAVDRRLATLVDELRTMTERVDSLRVVTDSVRRSRALVGQSDGPR